MEEIVNTFRDKKPYMVFSMMLFLVSFTLGYFLFWQDPEYILSNIEKVLGNIARISRAMEDKSALYVSGLIFQNNLRALLIIIFGGAFFGLIPFFAVIYNGLIVGIVFAMNLYQGNPVALFIASMLPHGLVEIPAIIAASAFGLKTGLNIIFPRGIKRWELFQENLKKSVLSLGLLVPLIFIAAGIEAIITPKIAKFFV
jgi:stage II sporulation protein M